MSTIKVDTVRPVTTDGSLTLQGDSSGAGVTGLIIDSTGTATTFNASNINGGQIGGFRNLIINGNFQVNQRKHYSITEETSGTPATGYHYDRWYYDGTTYLYQVIEGQDVRAVEHAISWSGSGLTSAWVSSANTTASIPTGFTTITNGSTFTPTASTNLWIRFGGTLANLAEVQVEAGSTATAFEHRSFGVELVLCQRYYQKSYRYSIKPGSSITTNVMDALQFSWGSSSIVSIAGGSVALPIETRTASPTFTIYDLSGNSGKVTGLDSGGAQTNNIAPNVYACNGKNLLVRLYNVSYYGLEVAYTLLDEL